MNSQHFDNIVDEAIDLLATGKSIDEIVRLFPDYATELGDVLGVSKKLVDDVTVSREVFESIVSELQVDDKLKRQTSGRSFINNLFFMNHYLTPTMATFALVFVLGAGLFIQESKVGVDDWQLDTAELADTDHGLIGNIVKRLEDHAMLFNSKQRTGAAPPSVTSQGITNSLGPASLGAGRNVPMSAGGSDTFSLNEMVFDAEEMASNSLGFSVGGAKDINNFRDNIENGYLPLPSDITVEGLYYDYYFETGDKKECKKLFCPSYSYAVSEDPLTNKDEYYLSVGLNSGMKASDFERKKLNLVVVLDISGSMSSPFNQYYYDRFGNKVENKELIRKKKIDVAKDAIIGLTKHLEKDDRFGVVLFDDQSYLAKPLSEVGETDMRAVRNHIGDIGTKGGTNMSAGIQEATELFESYIDADKDEYENRIIFLTDAMPNTGDYREAGLLGMSENNADNGLHTTFIGIGIDFNTDLIERITKTRGANYYSVHSAKEFETRMVDEFDYMITPLLFNLELKVESDGWRIEKVYGSPSADESTGEIMKVNTLFPSATSGGETKGGLVLLKMKRTGGGDVIKLSVRYETRNGEPEADVSSFTFGDEKRNHYDHSGIRKGVVLSRYAELLQNWTQDERIVYYIEDDILPTEREDDWLWEEKSIKAHEGSQPDFAEASTGTWERGSTKIRVSPRYEREFKKFLHYLENEIEKIGDKEMEREIELIEEILKY